MAARLETTYLECTMDMDNGLYIMRRLRARNEHLAVPFKKEVIYSSNRLEDAFEKSLEDNEKTGTRSFLTSPS